MSATEQAHLPLPAASAADASQALRWHVLRNIPLRLSVDIPLPAMSLRALRALQPGQVLSSAISTDEDLTIVIGGAPVCLARFEYMDGQMSIRTTRLLGALAANAAPASPSVSVPAANPGASA